jgi:hypothetical protein
VPQVLLFRGNGSQEMENAKKVEAYFMQAIKVIPEIIKVKEED